jgi:hypothetical protein
MENVLIIGGRDEERLRAALGRMGDGMKGAALGAADPKATARLAASLAPIDVLGEQQTKTRKALEFFSEHLAAEST